MFLKEEIEAVKKLFLSIHDHRFDFNYKVSKDSKYWSGGWKTAQDSFSGKTNTSYSPRLTDIGILDVLYGKKACAQTGNKRFNDIEFLGVGFGRFTKYFASDIDIESPYHNLESIEKIIEITKHIGLPLFMQSSFSKGWHLRWYFSEPIKTWDLAVYIKDIFTKAGFEIQGGKFELFPNKKGSPEGLYNRLRLPCQKGSALLRLEDGEVIASHNEDPELFLCYWAEEVSKNLISPDRLLETLSCPLKTEGTIKWLEEYKRLKETGFTGHSQTNRLLGMIAKGMVVFESNINVETLTKALCKWVDEKHNGLSEEYKQDPKITYDHCRRWAISALKRYKPLNRVIKHKKINHSKISLSAQYDHTLEHYLANGEINLNMSIREISRITGISKSAVQRKLNTMKIQKVS